MPTKSEPLLTTKEFAQKAGVSTATVSTWLKKGKIKGKKEGAKWRIAASELKKAGSTNNGKAQKKSGPKTSKQTTPSKRKTPSPKKAKPITSGKSFSVEAFSEMTFLTIYGVKKWLKEGRLTGSIDSAGQQYVDTTNLDNAHVKRLLR